MAPVPATRSGKLASGRKIEAEQERTTHKRGIMKKAIFSIALLAALAGCSDNDKTTTTTEPATAGTTDTSGTASDTAYTGSGINTGSGALTATDTGSQRRNQ